MRFRFLALAAAAALVVAGVAAGATMAAPDLAGTIGPGFTISLKNAGKNVATLKHGKYVFMVRDKSNIHNFTVNWTGDQEQDHHRDRFRRHEDGDADTRQRRIPVLLHRAPERLRDIQGHLSGLVSAGA